MEELYEKIQCISGFPTKSHHKRDNVAFILWNNFPFISSPILPGIFRTSGITSLFPAYTATVAEYQVWQVKHWHAHRDRVARLFMNIYYTIMKAHQQIISWYRIYIYIHIYVCVCVFMCFILVSFFSKGSIICNRYHHHQPLMSYIFFLTHWGREQRPPFSRRTFKNAFSFLEMYAFRLSFPEVFPKGPNNIIPALVQIMAWRRPGEKPLSQPMMVSLLRHICVTRPQWFNYDR